MQTIFKKSALFFLILAISLLTFAGAVFAEETDSSSEMTLDEIIASYAGKKVSIIGDSISTLSGISNDTTTNSTIENNTYYYSTSFGVNNTWWQQVINTLGMERLVNNSWSGSTVLNDKKGPDSAMYKTRCVNLHNDTTGEKPDIILVFGGTNDFTHYQSTLGTAAAIDYATLITENEDGTFTYATPATMLEAYAIMLHKMQTAYPDAEIFCANLLLRRDPVLEGKTDVGQPTEFNVELGAVIEKMGARLVDFENCGLESTPEVYDLYMRDQYVHPGARGMDLMSAAVLTEMLGVDCHPIIFDNLGTSRSNTAFYAINGNSYESDITLNSAYENLSVKVTMGGEDVTSAVYADGKVNIPSVTGHVVITATAEVEYKSHLQTLPEDLCCGVNLWATLTPTKTCFTNDYIWENGSSGAYSITFEVAEGDRLWATAFGAAGTNGNSSTSGIRLTWFLSNGSFKSISPANTYSEFSENGYMTAPEGAVAVNLIQWSSSTSYEAYILNKDHIYEAGTAEGGYKAYICTVCGHDGERIEDFTFDGAVSLDGFSIKLKSTETAVNGLRSISSFDWNKNASYEADGYTLLEFGAIALSKAQYETAEGNITLDTETGTLSGAKGVVSPVWKNGSYVGNTLVRNESKTQYALTIVNYAANFADDVYFAAYSVYSKDGSNEPIITIAGYADEEYKFMNLYQLTLDMYVNGAINSSNTDDTAVWNTLLTGVVTLTSSQYGTSATDMNGNAFGDSFTFKEVSQIYSAKTTPKENANIKITLLHDYATEKYVAIYRGSGAFGALSTNTQGYQLSSKTGFTKMSHPKLTSETCTKIETVIIDEGITKTSKYGFSHSYFKTLVYPASLTSFVDSSLYYCHNITTIYEAKATGYMQNNETGLVDLSTVSIATNNLLLQGASFGFTKLHLPSSVTQLGNGCVGTPANTTYKLSKIWCGDTEEPQDGIIDLSGATKLTKITGSTFSALGSGYDYTVILPDSCTSLSTNCFGNGYVTEIRQATYSANIVACIAANTKLANVKYCDLSGKEHPTEENTLRILAIGNSFSVDAMQWLYGIANNAMENGDLDYEYISLGNLKKSSCTVDMHWDYIQNDTGAYDYYTNTNGEWSMTSSYKLSTALASQQWDIITIQQESGNSGLPDSYSNLANVLSYVNENKTNADAKIYWHMTWAYQGDSTRSTFANYNNDQTTMYNAITSTVQNTVLTNESIAGVIPSGTAIQNMRTSYVGDTLTRDGYHLSYGLGRYIAGMTWFAYLTGVSVDNITYVPDEYKDISLCLDVVKESVKNALATPYAVTASEYTTEPEYTDEELFLINGLDFAAYTALDLTDYTHFQEYYQSEDYTPSTMVSGTNTAKKYIGIGTFDKTTLPIGSVIVLDSGYQYRPEGWIDADTKNTSRPGNVTSRFVVTDEAWWGSYTIRGFNLAHSGADSNVTESVSEHFRIYIPA